MLTTKGYDHIYETQQNNVGIFGLLHCGGCSAHLAASLFLIDGDTGFAKTGLGNTRCLILTYVLMIVCAAVTAFVTAYSSKRQPTQAPDIKQCKAIAPAAFLIVVYNAYSLISLAVSGNLSKIRLLLAVLLLLNIVFFTLYGASAFVNIRVPAILSTVPVMLSGYRLIEEFF